MVSLHLVGHVHVGLESGGQGAALGCCARPLWVAAHCFQLPACDASGNSMASGTCLFRSPSDVSLCFEVHMVWLCGAAVANARRATTTGSVTAVGCVPQEALSTPPATLKGPASAVEEPQREHAVEAVPSAPGDAAAQQPPAGPRPALAAVADAAAAGPAPTSSAPASLPSTSSLLTASASQPQETAKHASGSAPPPSSSSAGATLAEPGRGALSPAAVALASIAVGPVVEDPAESSSSQDGHGEESGLRKDPSLDTFGSDTSREWSLVSAGAGSSATYPSTQPAPA